jgi:molybdopterin-guanine dinucleotide biosynthesis protein A
MGDRLLQQRLPVVYSINFSQWSAYSALVPAERLVVDATEGEGPLKGVLSVCGRFPGRDLLVLACDMQDIDDATLGRLIGAWRAGGGEGYAYEAGGSLQPLCAIYTAGLLAGAGEKRSLREVLSGGAVCRLQGEPEAFRNYNTL